jgi:inner membrane protein
VLLALAAAWPRRRPLLLGLAFGVGAHFVRDIATGPGLPLGWPFSDRMVQLPYVVYAAVYLLAAGVLLIRASPTPTVRRNPRGRPSRRGRARHCRPGRS